ncbi:MAG: hypothetical protein HY319_30615 [Armatimonadetes bacterium]|nr:hypothetical protein [Armatimonadota bacterium]
MLLSFANPTFTDFSAASATLVLAAERWEHSMDIAPSSPYWRAGNSQARRYATLAEVGAKIQKAELLLGPEDRLGVSLWKDPGPEQLERAEILRSRRDLCTGGSIGLSLAALTVFPLATGLSGSWGTALQVGAAALGIGGLGLLVTASSLGTEVNRLSQPGECQGGSIVLQRGDEQGLSPSVLYYRPSWSCEGYPFEKVILAKGPQAEGAS